MDAAWVGMLVGYLVIFVARVGDMSLDVLRVLLLTRGRRLWAALVGFVEVCIFIVILNYVLQDGLTDPGKILAYAAGFATGNYIGSLIEERLAMGFISLQVFPPLDLVPELTVMLRHAGFGVTVVTGEGRDGPRKVLFILIKRKDLHRACNILNKCDPGIFFNITDARSIHGGVFPSKRVIPGK
ncbi:MAG: DUF5698 domain-containing protein [Clostridia bacterium]|nr:DUF5698 domain-containing protein [Clostridia bacterium]MDQ7791601.1 DUF5698 domain-containing protein [Clostridia bacterium]